MKNKFEGITLVDAATESSYVRSNGIFTAVSYLQIIFLKRCLGNQVEVELWLCSKLMNTNDSRQTCP
jgi:hypothetical protein